MMRRHARCICATLATLWLAPAAGSAYAETGADTAAGSINLGARGPLAAEAPCAAPCPRRSSQIARSN